LDILEDRSAKENHWVWSRDIASDVDRRFDKPLVTICGCLPRHPLCPVCHKPDVDGVVLTESVRDAIVSQVESAIAVETGGILLGFIDDDRKAIVVRATEAGPNAKRSATGFERDVQFVQTQLDQAAKKFGHRGLYIGEWHSHLEVEPQPSGRDIMSMCGIAEAPNYATRCPIMLIAGLDTKTGKVATMKTWTFPFSSRVYPIELAVVPDDELDAYNPGK
jgi:integrative and conjugative element protein (TIGR02256 family)